ncbi:hypothetical protein J6590_090457, partial [Homalodisca vitripennis]
MRCVITCNMFCYVGEKLTDKGGQLINIPPHDKVCLINNVEDKLAILQLPELTTSPRLGREAAAKLLILCHINFQDNNSMMAVSEEVWLTIPYT